jgi:hypothetical protein
MEKLKLFVVGESSSNPDDWDGYGTTAIVIAESKEQAKTLCPELSDTVTEIPLDRPMVIHVEGASGDD